MPSRTKEETVYPECCLAKNTMLCGRLAPPKAALLASNIPVELWELAVGDRLLKFTVRCLTFESLVF
jgi:hypothetical protein